VKSLNYLAILLGAAALAACTPEAQQVMTTETVTKVEVAAVETSGAPRYTSSASTGIAIELPIFLEGKLAGVQMGYQFRSQCERDLEAFFIAPNRRVTKVLGNGTEHCTGNWQTSFAENDLSEDFAGVSPKGNWVLRMRDVDANQYSARILKFTLVLSVDNGSGVVTHRFDVPGPDADIPQPN